MQNATDNHSQPSEQLTSSIAEMFVSWKRLFKNKIKDEDWGIDTVFDWAEILTELQITKAEFGKAERAVKLSGGWPPSHPADFLKLGRTDTASNYPDMRQEYLAAAQGKYKHEVTLETAKRVGTWELKTQPESVSYKSWQKHYPEVCKEHSEGKSFKVPESHQVEYSHTALQPDSPMSAEVDDFLNQFKRKHRDAV